jgi:hypothetical protein
MKINSTKTFLVLMLLLISSVLMANNNNLKFDDDKYDIIVENYLNGIQSNNFGLKTSSAFYLGELKSSEAVIPLLRILSNQNEDVRTRITAALSLYKIGDGRGIYRLKTTAKFDENTRLSELSERFYLTHILREMGYDGEIDENSLEEYVENISLKEMVN